MKPMSCLPLLNLALCQPILGQVAITGLLFGKGKNHWGRLRPNTPGHRTGVEMQFLSVQFLIVQFSIAQYGRLIRDHIIPIESGKCRESLC